MATSKYSHQRESIINFLTGRTDHPTADAVYQYLRNDLPNDQSRYGLPELKPDGSVRQDSASACRRKNRSLRRLHRPTCPPFMYEMRCRA